MRVTFIVDENRPSGEPVITVPDSGDAAVKLCLKDRDKVREYLRLFCEQGVNAALNYKKPEPEVKTRMAHKSFRLSREDDAL